MARRTAQTVPETEEPVEQAAPEVRALYEVRAAGLPRPEGGAYGVGDRFEADLASAAALSSLARRVDPDDPTPPPEVEDALADAPDVPEAPEVPETDGPASE